MAARDLNEGRAPVAEAGMPRAGYVLLFLLALFLRLSYLLEIHGTPVTQLLVLDADTYDRFARRILAGTFRGEDVYAMNALYPYVLAGVYALTHGSTFAALLVQSVIDALTCVITAWLGARLFDSRVGLLAGALAALAAPLVFYTGALLTPTWITFLSTAGTAALVAWAGACAQARRAAAAGWIALAGLAFGLATLGRGNQALALPLAWAVCAAARGARGAWRPWGAFALAFLVPVALVTWRNAAVEGRFVPVAANYAAFYVGHNPAANGLYVRPPWIAGAEFPQEVWGVRDAVARRVGHPMTLAESARWLFAQGLEFARTHPGAEARLAWDKFRYFWNGIESPTNLNLEFARDWSPLLRWLPVGFGLLAPLAAVGAWRARRRRRARVALALPIAIALLTALAVFVASEYRASCLPALCVLAAFAVVDGFAPEDGRRRLVSSLVVLALFAALALARPATLVRQANKGGDDVNFGTAYARRGEWVAARVLYERAIAADPANGFAYQGLAVTLDRLGDTAGAARAEEEARRRGALPAR